MQEVGLIDLLSCVDLVRDSQECMYLWCEVEYEVDLLYSGKTMECTPNVRQSRVTMRREISKRLISHETRVYNKRDN